MWTGLVCLMYTVGPPGMEHPLNALTTSRGSCKGLETNVCAQPRTCYLSNMHIAIPITSNDFSTESPSLVLLVSAELGPGPVCRRLICRRCVLTRLPNLDSMLVRAQDVLHRLCSSFGYVAGFRGTCCTCMLRSLYSEALPAGHVWVTPRSVG